MSRIVTINSLRVINSYPGLDFLLSQKLHENGRPKEYYPRGAVLPLTTNCIDYMAARSNAGYGIVSLTATKIFGDLSFVGQAHVISYLLHFNRDIPNGEEAAHICQENICVNPEHIVPCSHSLNKRMSYLNKGEGKPYLKRQMISTKQIMLIRLLGLRRNISIEHIAIATGLNKETIKRILRGETYSLQETEKELIKIMRQHGGYPNVRPTKRFSI